MKRLIKKADIDYNQFLLSLLNDNYYNNNKVGEIIDNNLDCIFSGTAYRVFYFYTQDIKEERDIVIESEDIDNHEMMWKIVDKLIQIDNKYQSFSKSMNGIKSVGNHFDGDKGDFSIVIECQIDNGLDISKLFEKYRDIANSEVLEAFSYFESQEEVLARFTDTDFRIENASEIIDKINWMK